jgi:Vitamin K-dependent gamma-carboxylase
MNIFKHINLNKPVSIAPLVTFRITFGLLMFFSIARFWWRGWITSVYVNPPFHFSYIGFEWIHALGNMGMHAVFAVMLISTFLITVGLFYRISIIAFFLSFTYVELIDVTTYLNHYYFISLIAFILIWLPANRDYSLDAKFKRVETKQLVPAWTIGMIRFQLGIVYIFAGLAKLNADWLLEAQPMRIWLPGTTHLPVVGKWMYQEWIAYLFAWFGAAYDLFIVFFLLNKKTRPFAFIFVIIFHTATAIFFPGIGMFPYVMMTSSLIFFSGSFHEKLFSRLFFTQNKGQEILSGSKSSYTFSNSGIISWAIAIYVFIQLIVPLRFMVYPGHLFWHEEGYRFSWRVMLMEKSGAAYFTVKDKETRQQYEVTNAVYLTALQEKMMSTQPDLILKYAHHLAKEYKKKGLQNPEIYAEVYVSLNGERSKLFIDSNINLVEQQPGWRHYNWVLPYNSRQTNSK